MVYVKEFFFDIIDITYVVEKALKNGIEWNNLENGD